MRGEEAQQDIWQILSRVAAGLIVIVLLTGVLSLFWPEVERQRSLDLEISELTAMRDGLKTDLIDRQLELSRLRNDQEYLEIVARDRLNMKNRGETIIRIVE